MISQDQLLKTYNQPEKNYFLLDVRTPYEYDNHHLLGSINIPIDTMEIHLNEIPKNKHIITICEHGIRSGAAAEYLVAKKYDCDSLDGGLSIWKGQLVH